MIAIHQCAHTAIQISAIQPMDSQDGGGGRSDGAAFFQAASSSGSGAPERRLVRLHHLNLASAGWSARRSIAHDQIQISIVWPAQVQISLTSARSQAACLFTYTLDSSTYI